MNHDRVRASGTCQRLPLRATRATLRRARPAVALVAAWLIGSRDALGCTVCYGDAEGPLIDAARLGVWLLFGLVVCVQAAFALFFVNLRRRARRQRPDARR